MDHRALARAAASQHGLITAAQAGDAGLSSRAMSRRVASGEWARVHPGVFAVGGAPGSWEQRAHAAVLRAGEGTVASHRTAARLWGLVDRSGRLEITIPLERRLSISGVTVHRSCLLPDLDRATRAGIPTTTLSRTIVDLAAHQEVGVVGAWIDQAMRVHGLDLRDLRSCVARLSGPGRRHLAPTREALAERLPGYDPGDSDLEVRALGALSRAGLPAPVQQHPFRRPDGTMALIDLAYPVQRIAIELDGWSIHRHRRAFDADRARANDLTVAGWRVLRFTHTTLDSTLVTVVRAALEATRP